MHPLKFADYLEEEAARLRKWKADTRAAQLEEAASDARTFWHRYQNEPLTLNEASDEGGYSTSRLSCLVGDEIPNAGEPGKPRIKRKHVPKQPGVNVQTNEGGSTAEEESNKTAKSKSEIADEILNEE